MGDVHTIFAAPRHPYTIGLMESLPRVTVDEDWLRPIPGQPPSLINRRPAARSTRAASSRRDARCREEVPPLRPIEETAHLSACHFAEELIGRGSKLHETVEQSMHGDRSGADQAIHHRAAPARRSSASRTSSSTSRSAPACEARRSARCTRSTAST